MKLNLGCGSVTPEAWINVDYAFGAWMAKIPLFKSVNRRLRLVNVDWDRVSSYTISEKGFRGPRSPAMSSTVHTLWNICRGRKVVFSCLNVTGF